MWPPAYTITMSAAPMASGAITPLPAPITVQPIVRTRKNVPMNSARYLFITYLLPDAALEKQDPSTMRLSSYRRRQETQAKPAASNPKHSGSVCLAVEMQFANFGCLRQA